MVNAQGITYMQLVYGRGYLTVDSQTVIYLMHANYQYVMDIIIPKVLIGTTSAFVSQDGEIVAYLYQSDLTAMYLYNKCPCHISCRSCLSGTFDNCTSCTFGYIPRAALMDASNPGICDPMSEACLNYY